MSEHWQVVYDGPSLPMIQSPAGDLYRIQILDKGQWTHSPFEPGTSRVWCEALNLFRAVNAECQRQQAQTEREREEGGT